MYCLGIKFTPLKAGHVLGAAMFLIEIDGATLLYTGDYSMEDDRHLPCADIDQLSKLLDGRRPDILIVESTHGINELQSRYLQSIAYSLVCCCFVFHLTICFYSNLTSFVYCLERKEKTDSKILLNP